MPEIEIRPAREADSDAVFAWRNDPVTRAMSHETGAVDRADHDRWFAAAIASDSRLLLICEAGGDRLGVVRFDLDGAGALVSINLAPDQRGKGLAGPCLAAATAHLFARQPQIETLTAEIKTDNIGSRKAFESIGFAHVLDVGETGVYRLTRP